MNDTSEVTLTSKNTIEILDETPKNPISLMGARAGICWGADIRNTEKNYKRGLECIKSDHGRLLEFVNVDMAISGYSARVMREYMRHVGGGLTLLQESTRYVDCNKFGYYMPHSDNPDINYTYKEAMENIRTSYKKLIELGMPKEDAANILPLGMHTKIVDHKNLRNLADMSKKRLCNRAYIEYRYLMHDIMTALRGYSPEWREVVDLLFKPQCDILGYCPEKFCCGRKNKK